MKTGSHGRKESIMIFIDGKVKKRTGLVCVVKKTSPGVVRGGDQGLCALGTLFMLPG